MASIGASSRTRRVGYLTHVESAERIPLRQNHVLTGDGVAIHEDRNGLR